MDIDLDEKIFTEERRLSEQKKKEKEKRKHTEQSGLAAFNIYKVRREVVTLTVFHFFLFHQFKSRQKRGKNSLDKKVLNYEQSAS